ncbi:Fur family transcriptional regulator [Vibrio fluminensis]|uniref:Fur family transcriptional regulator n=1 Tax=Vibrio fluminensis TaxID=2783614 RepID=UPI001888FE95|nr:transcriptional repressor [Vibrio fluminensis]
MQIFEAIIGHVEKRCEAKGKRLTTQRKLVLRALIDANQALSAYELVDYCKQYFGETIQAMSVYRILEFLEEVHLVHKLNMSNKYIVCSHIVEGHEQGIPQFLICSKCNKISEKIVAPETITGLQSHARQEGFTVVSPQLEINCVCDKCGQ